MTVSYAPDSPLAYLLDLAASMSGPDEAEMREDAATTAAHHVYTAYPQSLGQAVDADDWQGYPVTTTGDDRRMEPSAVAWLDGGLWLHHTLRITEQDGATDLLTLIVPCTCGRYTDVTLDSEETLLDLLADLAPTRGQSVHDDRHGDCASVRPAPPVLWSLR